MTLIEGGFIGGGATSLARRRYSRLVTQITVVLEGEPEHPHYRPLTFSDEDFKGIMSQEDDLMVIEVTMVAYNVQRVLVDQGSSADVMYWSDSMEMGGYVELLTSFGLRPNSKPVAVRRCYRNSLRIRRGEWAECEEDASKKGLLCRAGSKGRAQR
ncbi:hypothetical protein SESBI_06872 [Sesbania bispinosa]|nr:hypothetical protein SESBI_06872 [Sesbania bispinosa]